MSNETSATTSGAHEIRRDHVWHWLYGFFGTRGFRANENGPETLIDTCCAILILEGIGRLDDSPFEQRADFGAFIQEFQDRRSGLFLDELQRAPESATDWQASVRSTWFALQALDALGMRPEHPFRFLDAISDRAGIVGWLDGLDWSSAAPSAYLIASVLQLLIYRVEVERDPMAADLYRAVLEELDALQDRETGFWGLKPGVPVTDALLAAHRLLFCFEYVQHPIMRVSKLVDAALSLVQSDGSIVGAYGCGEREELAAADILASLGGQYKYRRDEIQRALLETRRVLCQFHREHDGFAQTRKDPAGPGPIETTWMRLLTLAAIQHACPDQPCIDQPWRFRRWPALAFYRVARQLNAAEHRTMPLWLPSTQYEIRRAEVAAAAPAISVVIPCYNLGRFLHRAVESVLAQTIADVEIIIVDDGSTDEFTKTLLDGFERPLTRVLRQANAGVAAARNNGIRASSGRYICCLDPDDRLRPEFLGRAVAILEKQEDVGIVTGGIETIDEHHEVKRPDTCELPSLLGQNPIAEAAVFRRTGWERAGGYWPGFSTPGIEDWDFWLTLVEMGYRVEILPEVVLEYRIRMDQMSSDMYKPERWGRLLRELADRHHASFAEHVGGVIEGLGSEVVMLRGWIDNRRRALDWWQRNAATWQRMTEDLQRRERPQASAAPNPGSALPYAPDLIDPENPDFSNTPASLRRRPFSYAPADPSEAPAVSIITPFFNVGEIFRQTARTVFRQSMQQWEWIIVNDGSTDPDALAMLAEYRDLDPRIRVLDHPVNLGLSAARNTGYREARSPYAVQLDGDDLLEPTAIEKWFWFLETHPEFDFVKGYSVGFGAQQYLWQKGFQHGDEFLRMNLVSPTAMVRTTTHATAGGYEESNRGGLEDWDFWLRCANAGRWGAMVPEYQDWYRRRPSHTDRWTNFDGGPRQQAFLEGLKQTYPRLWSGGFPAPVHSKPNEFDPSRDQLPCQNRLAARQPRLLLIVPWLVCGGADRFNVDVMDQLTALGWEVTLATTLNGDATWATEFSRYTPDIFILANFLDEVDYPRFLRYLIDSRRIEIVLIAHSALAYQLLPYLRAHCPDVAFADYCHVDEPVWANGGYPRFSVNGHVHLDVSIVSSQHLKRWMVREGASPDRIRVCYTNVDSDKWRPDPERRATVRAKLGISPSAQVILFVGRLCEQKQPRVLGESLKRLRDAGHEFVALIAGGGPDFDELRSHVNSNGLDSAVRLLGEVPHDSVHDLMVAADIFYLPSRWEGISLAIYEAMASGLAIVAGDVGGQRELVTPDCGILLDPWPEPDQAARYAEVLGKLLAAPEHHAAMGRNARERVRSSFKLSSMGSRMEVLLGEARRRHKTDLRGRVTIEDGRMYAARAIATLGISPPPVANVVTETRGQASFVYRVLRRLFRPAYHWGMSRHWKWLPRLGSRVRRALNP